MRAYESLRLFLHLSRTLRFARTAEACHISPAALSRAIQRLERDIDTPLFVRDKRNVELTRAGKRLQAYVGDLLEGWEQFERGLRGETLRGSLSIFCTVTAAQSLVPQTLGRFRQAHPDVHIRIETGYAADALTMLETGVDMAMAAIPNRVPRSIAAHTLHVTPLLFVAPTAPGDVSRLVERRAINWSEVPLVIPPFGIARDAVDRWFRQRKERHLVYSEIPSHEAILSLVAMGCGVGVVPELVLQGSALRDRVRIVSVRQPLGELHAAACVLQRRLREPLIAAVWDVVTGETAS